MMRDDKSDKSKQLNLISYYIEVKGKMLETQVAMDELINNQMPWADKLVKFTEDQVNDGVDQILNSENDWWGKNNPSWSLKNVYNLVVNMSEAYAPAQLKNKINPSHEIQDAVRSMDEKRIIRAIKPYREYEIKFLNESLGTDVGLEFGEKEAWNQFCGTCHMLAEWEKNNPNYKKVDANLYKQYFKDTSGTIFKLEDSSNIPEPPKPKNII